MHKCTARCVHDTAVELRARLGQEKIKRWRGIEKKEKNAGKKREGSRKTAKPLHTHEIQKYFRFAVVVHVPAHVTRHVQRGADSPRRLLRKLAGSWSRTSSRRIYRKYIDPTESLSPSSHLFYSTILPSLQFLICINLQFLGVSMLISSISRALSQRDADTDREGREKQP